jgi:hypothetical protein
MAFQNLAAEKNALPQTPITFRRGDDPRQWTANILSISRT